MSQSIPAAATLVKSSRQVSTVIDGEAVIMSLESGLFHGLGLTGGRIWELLDKPQTLESLLRQLLAEFDVGAEQCRAEVEAFIASLLERQLVEIDP